MEAVILAAGRGRRLAPLTDSRPKALVPVAGTPLLEHVARRLVAAGADRLVVNVHPFADRIRRFVSERNGFGVEVVFSHEKAEPLETGGALRHLRPLLRGDAPFLVHNVDVLTDLPLDALWHAQTEGEALATVAVMDRPTTRHLLFDDVGLLGRDDVTRRIDLRVRPVQGAVQALGFAGVQAVDPALFDRLTETGVFSIWEPYLRLVGEGAIVRPFRADGCAWMDVGRPEHLAEAHRRYGTPPPRDP